MENNYIYKSENNEMIFEHLYTVEDYATFRVCVKTNYFAGSCSFCIPIEIIKQCVIDIESIRADLTGNVILSDFDSDAYFEIGFRDKRNCIVKGQIEGSHEDNVLKFVFDADQTILFGLKSNLLQY